jgi:hypothetical protein
MYRIVLAALLLLKITRADAQTDWKLRMKRTISKFAAVPYPIRSLKQ